MKIPYHLGIIMDGNRRYAKERGLASLEGHREGLKNLKKIVSICRKKGVRILTVFAFSTENWNRSRSEVNYLMKLFESVFSKKNIKDLLGQGIRINVLGEEKRFSKKLQEKIKEIKNLTAKNKELVLNIALSYGGRADILESVKKIIQKRIPAKKISEDLISKNLWTSDMPDPDLIIRTGKEKRISNFLIWQAAYSELYFSHKYWPEFSEKDLNNAFLDYSRRKRNFGK